MKSGETQEHPTAELEQLLGYRFRRPELLLQALTHSSYRGEDGHQSATDNERLEFFGDAILGFLVSEALYRLSPSMQEGELSRARSNLVRAESFHRVAERLQLGRFLRLGAGEEKTGGRTKMTVLADAVEAVVAAIYLDGGLDVAEKFVREHLLRDVEEQGPESFAAADSKTRLQEVLQARGQSAPRYVLAETTGPGHNRTFLIELRIGEKLFATGRGRSKKAAEQEAAREAAYLLAREDEDAAAAAGDE